MFGFLKYVIFALGLLAVYVLIEHFVINRGESGQALSDSINQAEDRVVSKINDISENVNEQYVEPVLQEAEN